MNRTKVSEEALKQGRNASYLALFFNSLTIFLPSSSAHATAYAHFTHTTTVAFFFEEELASSSVSSTAAPDYLYQMSESDSNSTGSFNIPGLNAINNANNHNSSKDASNHDLSNSSFRPFSSHNAIHMTPTNAQTADVVRPPVDTLVATFTDDSTSDRPGKPVIVSYDIPTLLSKISPDFDKGAVTLAASLIKEIDTSFKDVYAPLLKKVHNMRLALTELIRHSDTGTFPSRFNYLLPDQVSKRYITCSEDLHNSDWYKEEMELVESAFLNNARHLLESLIKFKAKDLSLNEDLLDSFTAKSYVDKLIVEFVPLDPSSGYQDVDINYFYTHLVALINYFNEVKVRCDTEFQNALAEASRIAREDIAKREQEAALRVQQLADEAAIKKRELELEKIRALNATTHAIFTSPSLATAQSPSSDSNVVIASAMSSADGTAMAIYPPSNTLTANPRPSTSTSSNPPMNKRPRDAYIQGYGQNSYKGQSRKPSQRALAGAQGHGYIYTDQGRQSSHRDRSDSREQGHYARR